MSAKPFQFRLNPRYVDLPHSNAVLNGVGSSYRVAQYRTTLSLKAVTRGAAYYTTRWGRHLVTPDRFLILNDGQEYALEFHGPGITETICPFFQPGFVEHAAASLATSCIGQLDDPGVASQRTEFANGFIQRPERLAAFLRSCKTSSNRSGTIGHGSRIDITIWRRRWLGCVSRFIMRSVNCRAARPPLATNCTAGFTAAATFTKFAVPKK